MTLLQNIGGGLADLVLTLLATLLLVRALLFSVNADPFHPLVKFVIDFTRPILVWPHKIIPPTARVDAACWLSAFLACALEIYLLLLFGGSSFRPVLFILALVHTAELTLYIFIAAILVVSIGSWFMSPHQALANPLISLFHLIVAPALSRVRRVVPPFGAVDLSPVVLLLLIYLALIVLRSLF